jgi:hypothetical protein
MSIKQDRCLPRTALDVDRRYSPVPNDVEELREIIKDFEVDTTLSASSSNAISNSAVTKALNNKVTKVAGKGLSTNDFTDDYKQKIDNTVNVSNDFTEDYKNKLDNIEARAEVNLIEKIYIAGKELTPTNKAVNIYVDSSMSDYSENPVQNKVIKQYIDDHIGSGGSGGESAIYQEYHTDYAGYVWFTDGFLVQWGRTSITPTAINTDTTARITFTYSYDNIPDRKTEVSSATPTVAKVTSGGGTTTALSKQGMNIYVNSSTTKAVTVDWKATGYKST